MTHDEVMQLTADNIRWLSAAMPQAANSGHPGGPMGGADFINLLYAEYLVYDPDDALWPERDRFFLDAGHLSAMLYATLGLVGRFTTDELARFRQWESPTPGHPERDPERGIENTSGPLGQGHGFGVGAALAERFLAARFGEWLAHKTFIYITDGGIQEELSQGIGRIAGFLGLSSVVMFYDANDVQLSTKTDIVTHEDTAAKYRAWGWKVHDVNGHDLAALRAAMDAAASETGAPTLIIGRTVMGKGARRADGTPWEGDVKQHGAPFGKDATIATIRALGGDPERPFHFRPEAIELHRSRQTQLRAIVAERRRAKAEWAAANPDKAAQYEQFLSGRLPDLDWSRVSCEPNLATRNASAKVLAFLGENVPNMVVCSADLADSDKTEAFLKKTRPFARGDFGGAFLHAGVSEMTMAALCVGMNLHGGVIPACGTFFAFSDFQKPTMRLAALQEAQVIFVFTHDSFRVGEDGPTHQPIEQEAQIRLLEQMKNLNGRRSFLVLRPGDSAETVWAWRTALENHQAPSALILTRQDVPDLPAAHGDRRAEAQGIQHGAYVLSGQSLDRPDLILLANGSEAGLAESAATILRGQDLKVRTVSIPSIGLFREQDEGYRHAVLPEGVPVLGITAGLPSLLEPLVGPFGAVFGMGRFGASASFKVLDAKFGYTPENVAAQAKALLAGIPARAKALRAQADALLRAAGASSFPEA